LKKKGHVILAQMGQFYVAVYNEDDPARIAFYQRISADLERAHASVVAYYEGLAATEAAAPFARGGAGRPAGKPPRLVDLAQVQRVVSAMQRRQAAQSIEDIFAVYEAGQTDGTRRGVLARLFGRRRDR